MAVVLRAAPLLAVVLAALGAAVPAPAQVPAAPTNPHVTFDLRSLKIDGRRVILNSGEVHYSRMPDPREWPIVLDRMKAAGLNAISIYIPWGYHVPAPGRPRFDGRYDVERFLALARDRGLYVVARHGPYVQGEMDGGGYPSWLLGRPGMLRTTDPLFTEAWKGWNAQLLPRIARWEPGGPNRGTVIAVQVENEYSGDGPDPESYMRDQVADARRNGITVPILHNDQQVLGTQPSPGRYGDIVDLFGFDNYPYGFACCKAWDTATFSQVDGFEERYRQRGATRSPLYMPEVQGGIATISGDDGRTLADRYERFVGYGTVQDLSLIGQGLTMINRYMFFGGTTWGYTLFPNLGSSYDYAAPIREWTALGPRFEEQRRLSLQLAATASSLAATVRADDAVTVASETDGDAGALYRVRRSETDGGLHVVLRNADSARAMAPRLVVGGRTTLPVPLPQRSARYLPMGLTLAGWKLDVTTAEVALATPSLLVLFGDRGRDYEAVIGGRRITFTPGKARLLAFDRGRKVLVLDRFGAGRLWRRGAATIVGPSLVTPKHVVTDRVTNAAVVRAGRLRRVRLAGPPPAARLKLPVLRSWRFAAESPEREPDYDDAAWRSADVTTTTNQVQPLTSPILFADAYEQPTGYVWYRGRFEGSATGVCLEGRHQFHVWLNGRSVGTVRSDAEVPGPMGLGGLGAFPPVPQATHLRFPAGAVRAGANVLSVLTDDWGHTMDAPAFNQAKQPRGLWSAALDRAGSGLATCGFALGGETGVTFGQRGQSLPPVPGVDGGIAWKLRGGRTEDYPNASGLHGERAGWYRAGFDDRRWSRIVLPDAGRIGAGEVGWYRTTFRLRLPRGVDAPLALALDRDGAPGELFLNGVHVARVGRDRETRFTLMPGLLRRDGRRNVVAYARWAIGPAAARMPRPRLVALAVERRTGRPF